METLKSAQVYRGFAALIVVCHHSNLILEKYFTQSILSSFFSFGHAGVEFFFVLSGFILFHIYNRDNYIKGTNIKDFALKRFIRIYPIYWIITIIFLPFWLYFPNFGEVYHKQIESLFFSLLLVPQNHFPHVGVAWSLTHEVFFYLFFAAIIINKKYGSVLFALWMTAIITANTILGELKYPFSFIFSKYNLLFGFGIISGLIIHRFTYFIKKYGLILFIVGNLLFLATGIHENYFFEGKYYIWIFGFASFLVIIGFGSSSVELFFKNKKILIFFGDASYSIYLVHYFVLSFACKIISKVSISQSISPNIIFIALLIAGITGGVIFYLIIEKQFLGWIKNKYLQKEKVLKGDIRYIEPQPLSYEKTI